jgi:hypothetical protein
MRPDSAMAGRIRAIDCRFIRLTDPVRANVDRLARLAGVTGSEVVNFVLTEVFAEADDADGTVAPAPTPSPVPVPRRRARGPADVIPITRRETTKHATVAREHEVPPGRIDLDLGYLRLLAADARRIAQKVRVDAAAACCRADRARDKANRALEDSLSLRSHS